MSLSNSIFQFGRIEVSNQMKIFVILLGAIWLCDFVVAQQERRGTRSIDVQHYEVSIEVVPESSFLKGEGLVRLKVLEEIRGLPFELNKRVSLIEIVDEEDVSYSSRFDDFESETVQIRGTQPFQKGSEITLKFRFEGTLEKEDYTFLDTPQTERAVIDTEGAMLLSEGKWFPAHALPLDAATAELKVTVPLGFTAVAPGILQSVETRGVNEVFTWRSDQPLTQIPVVVGKYLRQEFRDGVLPVTFFVTEAYDRDLQPVVDEVLKAAKFMSDEYGDYPISSLTFAQLGNVELPSSGCLGLILLDSALAEAKDLPVTELAKRVARQWWGYSVRFQEPYDAWLQDGFATYAALRYMEAVYPDQFASALAREAVQALKYEKRAAVIKGLDLEMGSSQYNSIVESKGAWVLYMLGQLVGKQKFDDLLGEWYRRNADQSTTTAEFVEFVQEVTKENYRWFFTQWVESVGIPEFRTEYTIFKLREGGFKVRGQISQNLELFRMPVDISIETKGKEEEERLMVSGKSTSFLFETENMPLRFRVDPHGKILLDSVDRQMAVQVALGDEFRRKGEFGEAIRAYEKAKAMDARSTLAHFRLAEVFFQQHNYSSAANSFRDALNGDLKPEWVETWIHIYLGKIYDVLGERQRALAEYQKAINSKIDYNGAQAEALKYQKEAYSKPKTVLGS